MSETCERVLFSLLIIPYKFLQWTHTTSQPMTFSQKKKKKIELMKSQHKKCPIQEWIIFEEEWDDENNEKEKNFFKGRINQEGRLLPKSCDILKEKKIKSYSLKN